MAHFSRWITHLGLLTGLWFRQPEVNPAQMGHYLYVYTRMTLPFCSIPSLTELLAHSFGSVVSFRVRFA
jgi:hypothetical protein